MKRLLIAALVLSALGVSLDVSAEQKIVICGEGYRETAGIANIKPLCQLACRTPQIEDYLKDGWNIVTNQPTRFTPIVSEDNAKAMHKAAVENGGYFKEGTPVTPTADAIEHMKLVSSSFCECNGTKYVLSKEEKKIEVAPEPDPKLELMKKEIELLKKENDMLKKDGELLKQENEVLKKKTVKKK